METKAVTITFENGLHMRPAASMVEACRPFDAEVAMEFNGVKTNLKSVLGVVGAKVKKGDAITLHCSGPQETEAMAALMAVVAPK